ncbi:MAG: YfiT family bacillithiol transferase [Vicinamibacterales bacterium]
MSDDLRFPVGKFAFRPDVAVSPAERAALIGQIADAPGHLAAEVTGLTDAQLDTPYRPGGWTVRQVVHHVPDSHLNAYIRCKLAVTEEHPKVKTYEEALWAELVDARTAPINVSLTLLAALHQRWVPFLRSLDAAAFARTSSHPEWGEMRIDDFIQLYAWHGRHHVAHIQRLKERSKW